MTGRAAGITTALSELLADASAQQDDGQVDLFDPADFGDDLPGPTTAVAKSGPQGGRPAGRRNKSTEKIRAYIASHYKHPLIVLAEMWSRTPKELAKEMELYELKVVSDGEGMGSSVQKFLATGEAARLQQQALIAALPYLAQKMPIQVEQKIKQMGVLMLGEFNQRQQGEIEAGLPIANDDEQIVDVVPLERSPLGGDA